MPKSLSLYELNSLVSSIIAIDLPDEYWVEAEISETREVRGHCYMELVEKDELQLSVGLRDGRCCALCLSVSQVSVFMPA